MMKPPETHVEFHQMPHSSKTIYVPQSVEWATSCKIPLALNATTLVKNAQGMLTTTASHVTMVTSLKMDAVSKSAVKIQRSLMASVLVLQKMEIANLLALLVLRV